MSLRLSPPLALFGIPLPKTSNPVLAVPLDGIRREVRVSFKTTDDEGGIVLKSDASRRNDILAGYINEFYRKLVNVLGKSFVASIEIPWASLISGNDLSMYALASFAALYAYSVHEDVKPPIMELLRLAKGIDELIFSDRAIMNHVMALRLSAIFNKTVIYRRDERPLYLSETLPILVTSRVKQLNKCEFVNEVLNLKELHVLLVKLAGLVPILAFKNFGDESVLRSLFAVENALYHMVYNVELPSNTRSCKWVLKNHLAVQEVCMQIREKRL